MMSWIQCVAVESLELQEFAEENILGALLPGSNHVSAAVGVVKAGEAQARHHQDRPEAGAEIMVVFRGAVEVMGDGGTVRQHDCDGDGPLFVLVESGATAYLRNVGKGDVWFLGIFAPPFREGEIVFT